jgi:hypothetical protein
MSMKPRAVSSHANSKNAKKLHGMPVKAVVQFQSKYLEQQKPKIKSKLQTLMTEMGTNGMPFET